MKKFSQILLYLIFVSISMSAHAQPSVVKFICKDSRVGPESSGDIDSIRFQFFYAKHGSYDEV